MVAEGLLSPSNSNPNSSSTSSGGMNGNPRHEVTEGMKRKRRIGGRGWRGGRRKKGILNHLK